jgi:glutamate 5-kinase
MSDHPHPEERLKGASRRGHVAAASPGLAASRRLIVKIGSALLVDEASGDIRHGWLAALMEDVARCRSRCQ